MRLLPRVAALLACGAALAAVPVLGIAGSAQAHNYLVSSTPSAGATLTVLPEAFEITTNEPLLDLGGEGAGFALQIIDSVGRYYGDGCVSVSGASMSAVPAIGAPGDYEVVWQVVSSDGHTVSGDYSFSWAPVDPSVDLSAGSKTVPDCGGKNGGTVPGTPGAGAGTSTRPGSVDLGDVLWIGGTVLAVGLAIAVSLFVVGRKSGPPAGGAGSVADDRAGDTP